MTEEFHGRTPIGRQTVESNAADWIDRAQIGTLISRPASFSLRMASSALSFPAGDGLRTLGRPWLVSCSVAILRASRSPRYGVDASLSGSGTSAAMPHSPALLSRRLQRCRSGSARSRLVLRAIIGFGCAGIFVTTESWLNAKAQPAERGRVFSIYMVGTFLALAVGQLLIGRAKIETTAPFNAIVVLFAVALVMVSTTRAEPPRATATKPLPFGQLSRAAPVAVVGCAVERARQQHVLRARAGVDAGRGTTRATIALFMLVAVLGGLAFQVPVGWVSDRFDRRIVLAGLGLGFAGAAVGLVVLPRSLPMVLTTAALLGGFMSTLYPVCVAYAHDCMPADRVLAVSGRLILVSGLGSVVGPLVGTSLMTRFDINGVFYLMAAAAILLALMAAGRSMTTAPT